MSPAMSNLVYGAVIALAATWVLVRVCRSDTYGTAIEGLFSAAAIFLWCPDRAVPDTEGAMEVVDMSAFKDLWGSLTHRISAEWGKLLAKIMGKNLRTLYSSVGFFVFILASIVIFIALYRCF